MFAGSVCPVLRLEQEERSPAFPKEVTWMPPVLEYPDWFFSASPESPYECRLHVLLLGEPQ